MRRLALALLFAVCAACGGARVHPEQRSKPAASASAAPSASATPAGPSAMERLAATAQTESPGMRELLRRDVTSTESARVEIAAQEKDECLRVFVDATFPAKATLESKGRELASGEAIAGAALVLNPRGPVCVRRGEAPVLRIEGTGTAQVIVRVSP